MMRPRFTEAGKALQLRALAGTQITFTKMQLGDGSLGETNYKTLTALISPKATLSLSGIRIEDGSATVRGEFNNANMVEGFYYRELGLFAQDPDNAEQEILYCYANFGDECQYIAEPSSAMISRTVRIVATVDDAPNVTAILNDNAQYVDRTELMQILEQHNISETAHRNLMDFEVTYYVDSTTQEDADDRDGSEDHPFMTIQEAADAIPLSALRVMIYLKTGGATYVGLDDDYTFTDFQRIEVLYEGSIDTRPIIAGHLRFKRCENVTVENLAFTSAAATEIASPVYLDFNNCSHVWVYHVRGYLLSDSSNSAFLAATNSAVNISNLTSVSAANTLKASGAGSVVYLSNCTIDGGSIGVLSVLGAMVIINASVTNTAYNQYLPTNGGFIYDLDTIDDISLGYVHAHLINETNPHKVSLTQAQAKGGTVNVAHGGTGQTSFDSGALIKGNGTDDLAQLLGTGALYAAASGSPQFGTLPVSAGGTGRTDNGTYVQSSPTNGVLHGSVIVPGTPIVIMWGKINTHGNTTYSHDFEQYHNAKFANTAYVLTFSGQDDVWGSITKSENGFSVAVGGIASGSYVADWIAIGVVDEEE